jgi:DNA polymerase-3 subunit gamma/tau
MALNCQSPEDGEPDGTCLSCTAIRAGASMDVFELDAASNRKLEEMRDLLSRVALATPGRWKVYIIDEVHQLTGDAASALLKTLEEPPSHVVFVLATTDPQKVLPTILSRTQHFEFRLLDGDVLTDLLTKINEDAGLALGPTTVRLAVQRGRGSARDAESALEQLAAAGSDEDDAGLVAELAEALAERDMGQTLQAVARAVMAGREPRRLGNDLLEHLRNAFLSVQAPSLVLLPAAATPRLTENARQMGLPLLVRAMETLGQALVDMRDSVDPRVTLEVALIRLVSPSVDPSPGAILERVERLERALTEKAGLPGVGPFQAGAFHAAPFHADPPPSGPPPSGPPPSGLPPTGLPPTGLPPTGTSPISPSSVETAFGGTALGPVPSPRLEPGTVPEARPEGQGPPTAGPAQPTVALGAYLRAGGPAGEGMPVPAASARPVAPVAGLAPAPEVLPAGGDLPGRDPGAKLPSRDELTKAWGDTVLNQLSRPAKVYLAGGRFIEVTGAAAVFGLPGEGLLARASNFRAEAESALAAHFGRPVPLRLVLDDRPGTGPGPVGPPPAPEETYDLDEMGEMVAAPPLPEVPAEQRLLQAFPGSSLYEG